MIDDKISILLMLLLLCALTWHGYICLFIAEINDFATLIVNALLFNQCRIQFTCSTLSMWPLWYRRHTIVYRVQMIHLRIVMRIRYMLRRHGRITIRSGDWRWSIHRWMELRRWWHCRSPM